VYGDHLDTDEICPAGILLSTSDPEELARHAMEPIDPQFHAKVEPGDFLLAGRNAGCGSSREQAPLALKGAGIAVVIAESFARLFYRNCITIGLPALRCPGIRAKVSDGDELRVDFLTGRIHHLESGDMIQAEPLREPALSIVLDGGLIKHILKRMRGRPATEEGR
jgi:3-isopropylmalate/(R)-2-methylmalate dehydratase small subunit